MTEVHGGVTGGTTGVLGRLPEDTWAVFHDVRRTGAPGDAVDHVVLGPPGVFVVEFRSWPGLVTVHDRVLRHEGQIRDDVVSAAMAAADEVADLVPTALPGLVQPVLCFAGGASLNGWAGTVPVRSEATLLPWLTSLPPVLTAAQVSTLVGELEAAVEAQRGPRLVPVVPGPRRVRRAIPLPHRPALSVRSMALGVVLTLLALVAVFLPQLERIGDRVNGFLVGGDSDTSQHHDDRDRGSGRDR